MRQNKIIELEAIIDLAINEISKGGISPEDADVILMSLIDDYNNLGHLVPDTNLINTYIMKYVKK